MVKVKTKGKDCFYLAGHHFDSSACMVWPVTVKQVPGNACHVWYDVDCDLQAAVFINVTCLDPKVITGMCFEWRSWRWQKKHTKFAPLWRPAWRIIMKKSVKFVKLDELASAKAWWNMPKSEVQDYVDHLGLHIPPGLNLFRYLLLVIQLILKIDEKAALVIMQQRLIRMRNVVDFEAELFTIDEAVEVLEKNDAKEVIDDQKRLAAEELATDEFAQSYKEVITELRHRDKDAVLKRKKPKKGELPLDGIPHDEAKSYAPPGGYVWRGLINRSWNGHLQDSGYARVSRSWDTYTEPVALKMVLGTLWKQYLEKEVLDEDDCPWPEFLKWAYMRQA